ncbi:hypothetical protein [uncultured Tateyamaria sp.]|uniref:hypothetical protein n=1 Tax=uncultured Tateyamaria sp. TaxID=455651 RepID=UPI0026375F3B|nr:hypothetical protein [uncultured Tateyamaria sp.]
MNSRDSIHRDVLIAGSHTIEVMDMTDHLLSRGWNEPVTVKTAKEAIALLETRGVPFSLTVVMVPTSDPIAMTLVRICSDEGSPVVIVDGAASVQQAGQVVVLARPFIDTDMDQALRSLSLMV